MSAFEVYCILILDNVSLGLSLLAVGGSLPLIVLWVVLNSEQVEGRFKVLIPFTVLWAACFVFSVFIPNTKQAAMIFVAPKIINSEFMQEDLPAETRELYELAKEYLKCEIEKSKEKTSD